MATGKRIVFMGTSSFAALILKRLIKSGEQITAVYTQPDRESGRGMRITPSEVKKLAQHFDLPVYQPVNFREEVSIKELADLKPDFLIVASYGLILSQKVLDVPSIAPINIHASLLPVYRGAAPIQYAVKDSWQNDITGVSIMRMEKGMDTGPVYAMAELKIEGRDAEKLTKALAELGADLLIGILPDIANGSLKAQTQDHAAATYTAKLVKTDGRINWKWPAARVDSLIRAMHGWPGAQSLFKIGDKEYSILLEPGIIGEPTLEKAGTINIHKDYAAVATDDCWYILGMIRPQGRKAMNALAFFNGLRCGRGNVGTAI